MSGKRVTIRNSPYLINSNKPLPKKVVFMNNVNSYTGRILLKNLLKLHEENDENLWYEVFATLNKRDELTDDVRKVLLLHSEDESFSNSVTSCDIIIFDISQNFTEAKKFFKYFENELENSRVDKKKQIILISTIMTWAMTQTPSVMTDSSYRKRRPHPSFIKEFILERDVINLSKKYKKIVSSVVVCPGIVYGERQDVFHFVYNKCYFNHLQLNIFAPGTNYLPVIYIEDFARIMMDLIKNEPGSNSPYILAVQPEPIDAISLISVLSEPVGGSETRIKISNREDIFTMDQAVMTQNVFNHMTLNLRLESEYLKTFNFEITGANLAEYSSRLSDEYYTSRGLKPLKILIDGSPYSFQSELAQMIANFYSLHRVSCDGFLENFHQRLKLKIQEAEEYLHQIKSVETSENVYSQMIEKVKGQLVEWKGKLDEVTDRLKSDSPPAFHEIQECVITRLTSFACSKHQGYVMEGFQLDSEMASYLFLEPADDGFEFNELTKPDYIILLNRVEDRDELCDAIEEKLKIDGEKIEESGMRKELKEYYDSHYDDVSLLNFFLDRDIIPIEITFDRDQTESDLKEIFESIKSKIGSPRNYGLSKAEKEEIFRLKQEIAKKEAEEKLEAEKQKALEKEREKIEKWTQETLDKKRQEFENIEKNSLPTRQYLMKYVLPKITDGLTEVAKQRPENPVEFLAKIMLSRAEKEANGDPEVDGRIVKKFRNIVEN